MENLDHAIRTSAREESRCHEANVVELYEDRPHPRSEAFPNSTHHRADCLPTTDGWPDRRRGKRDVSPWSCSSDDGGDGDNDNADGTYATTSGSRQDAPTIRNFLLAESATDGRKVMLLQEWIRDYGGIVRQIQALDDSATGRRTSERSYENDRIHDIVMDAARIELGPRSITDTRDRATSPLEELFRQPVVRVRANNGRMYVPRFHEERRGLPERSRGSEDDSSGTSRTAQYGESRRPTR